MSEKDFYGIHLPHNSMGQINEFFSRDRDRVMRNVPARDRVETLVACTALSCLYYEEYLGRCVQGDAFDDQYEVDVLEKMVNLVDSFAHHVNQLDTDTLRGLQTGFRTLLVCYKSLKEIQAQEKKAEEKEEDDASGSKRMRQDKM